MSDQRTATQIAVAMSGLRSTIAKSDGDQRDKAVTKLAALEPEYRAALALEATEIEQREQAEDGESRELRELRSNARVGAYVAAAMGGVGVNSGAEAELNQELGLPANHFPLSLLDEGRTEHRAATSVDGQANQQTWIDRLFEDSAATRVGVTMRSVRPGVASVPVTTAGASFAMKEKEAAAGDAAWTIGVTELKPKRGSVRAVFTVEDAARLPGLENALRRDLRMAMVEGVDTAVFVGADGGGNNTADIVGLNAAAGVVEKTLKQADKVKADKTLAAFVDLVDGKHAAGLKDLSIVAAIGANKLWATTLLEVENESASMFRTLANFLRVNEVAWSVRGGIEADTADGDFGAFIGRKRGIAGAGTAAVWDSAELIRDPYSGAAKGEVAVTMHYLWDLAFPRAANFARLKFVA